MIDIKTNPPGYEPEPWDVVRDDGVRVITGVGIAVADEQCAWLNKHPSTRRNKRHTYEVEPACENSGINGG